MCVYVCACVLVCVFGWTAGQQATARFDGKGIKGYINFAVESEGVRIQTNLQGLLGEAVIQNYGKS